MKIIAKTFFGLESVLAEELSLLGADNVQVLKRAVSFDGHKTLLYTANLKSRLALKFLVPIVHFQVNNENDFYQKIRTFDWSKYLSIDQTFVIKETVHSEIFKHSKFIALKMKDGIVDHFRAKTEERPSVSLDKPDIILDLHISKNQVNISIDSTGEPLSKRGYRNKGHYAPLNEVLAAGMLALSGWKPDRPLHDMCCGTGTILLEAAMIAANMAPSIHRKRFAFMEWPDFDRELWKKVTAAAVEEIDLFPEVNIYGGDINGRAIATAKASAKLLRLHSVIKLEKKPLDKQRPSAEEGMLIFNPPYGERMEKDDIESFYQSIGDQLKGEFTGWQAWLLSSNKDALKHIGLRTSQKLTLFNGPLECKFQRYDLYRGSKKSKVKD